MRILNMLLIAAMAITSAQAEDKPKWLIEKEKVALENYYIMMATGIGGFDRYTFRTRYNNYKKTHKTAKTPMGEQFLAMLGITKNNQDDPRRGGNGFLLIGKLHQMDADPDKTLDEAIIYYQIQEENQKALQRARDIDNKKAEEFMKRNKK